MWISIVAAICMGIISLPVMVAVLEHPKTWIKVTGCISWIIFLFLGSGCIALIQHGLL